MVYLRVIKNINNNVAICLDEHNREAVVFGKGIGFIKPPRDVTPDKIERIYYRSDEQRVRSVRTQNPSDEQNIREAFSHVTAIIEQELNIQLQVDSYEYVLLYLHISHLIHHDYEYMGKHDISQVQKQDNQNIDLDVRKTVGHISDYLKENYAVEDNWIDYCFALLLLSQIKIRSQSNSTK